jgi:hypothetical protein
VTITRSGAKHAVFHTSTAAATGSHTFRADPGGNYVMTVTDRDLAGQTSAATTKALVVPRDDLSFTFAGDWTHVNGRTDFAGSHATASSPGATATVTARGRRYALDVRTGPMYGKLAISLDGITIGTYDLYSPGIKHLHIVFFGTPTTPIASRTFAFRYTGRKNPLSTARTVNVDALYVFR